MAFVTPQTTAVNSAASGTAVTCAYPSGISSGDLLLFIVVANDNSAGSATTPTDFTPIQSGGVATTAPFMATFYKIATGSESGNISSTLGSNTAWYARSIRLTGNNSVGVNVSSESNNDTADTSAESATLTPTSTSTLLMIVAAAGSVTASGYTVTTSDPTWTEFADAVAQSLLIAVAYGDRQEITATGAGSATLSGSARSVVHLISCEPSGHSFSANFALTSGIQAAESSAQTATANFAITASIPNTTVTEAGATWQNQSKSADASFNNLSKS